MRVLIVDDEPPARLALETMLAKVEGVSVGASVGDGLEALSALAEDRYDLVFADISMPNLGGLELVDRLPDRGVATQIVFVTAHAEHAVRAFELEATDYLLKPVAPDRLAAAIERCQRRQRNAPWPDLSSLRTGPGQRDHLWVDEGTGRRRIGFHEVEYIAGEGDYVRIHTSVRSYLANGSLERLAADMSHAGFLRVHRSRIVRLAAVRRIETDTSRQIILVMDSGAKVRVGRRNSAAVRAAAIGKG